MQVKAKCPYGSKRCLKEVVLLARGFTGSKKSMIRIGKCILEPIYWREPHYKGGLFPHPEPALYSWGCVSCQSNMSIVLSDLNMFPSLELSQSDEQIINERFEIGVAGRSKEGGWPCFHRVICPNCNQAHLVYVGYQEPSNSMIFITVHAICGLDEEANV